MEESIIFRSPVICYEVSKNHDSYDVSVYMDGHKNSQHKTLNCKISNFSCDKEEALKFAFMLSESAALPIHIPELAEEFLSF